MSSSVPVAWVKVRLEDVVEVRDFEREPINSTERSERLAGKSQSDLYPYYGATGQVGWIDAYRSEGQQVLLGEDGAPFLDANRDKAYLVSGRYWVNNHAHVLRGLDGLVENRLLAHQLNITDFHSFVSGSTRLKLTSAAMKRIPFLLPPFNEQTRIVEKLEELLSDLDAGVAELKAAQRKLSQYRQSLLKAAVEGALTADWRAARHSYDYPPRSSSPRKRGSTGLAYPGVMDSRFRGNDGQSETGADLLQRILTERRTRWETRQLAKFAEQGKTPPKDWQARYPEPVVPDTTDLPALPDSWAWASIEQVASDERHGLSIGPFGSNLKVSDYRESGVPLVFVRNIRSATYDGDKTKYVTPEKAASLHAHAIQGGDVLITKMGEPPGDADVYPDWLPPAIITADCIKVRCQQGLIHPSFLAASINSSTGRRQIGPITQGVAQKKVSLGRFISIAVPVPPLREQTEIVDLLTQAIEDADAQSLAIEASLKQSSAQRKNILKAAFAGQLVPQDPNDEPASVLLERIRTARVNRADKTKSVAKRGLRA